MSLFSRSNRGGHGSSPEGLAHPEAPVVIIGGGIAGLSCGCYLRMNGYATEILEANPTAGGLCVAWDRGPYRFDGCLRWLVGTNPDSAFHRVWRELGALDGRKIINFPEFLRVAGGNGQVLALDADLGRLADNLKKISPDDGPLVDELVRDARRCAPLDPPLEKPLELMSGIEKTRLLFGYMPMLPAIIRWKGRQLGAYLERYRSPLIRAAFEAVAGDKRMSALVLVMVLGWRSRENTGYVTGGSRVFSDAILARYTGLGGIIHYNARVAGVTLENGRATGVRLHNGENRPASAVVSCADGRTTVLKMLGGRHVSKRLAGAYANGEVFPGLLQVSLGINQHFPKAPHSLNVPLTTPLDMQDSFSGSGVPANSTLHPRLEVAIFGPECELCPAGKTIMIVRLATHYDFWTDLKQRRPADYAKAKERVLKQVVSLLDQTFPGVARNLEASDVATPATFERYTANWRGSIQGWLPTPAVLGKPFPRTLPGLKNFYMAGHWVELGGGLPPAALSGRYVAQMICARDGRKFATTTPGP